MGSESEDVLEPSWL